MNDQRKTFIAFVKLGTFFREFCNGNISGSEWHKTFTEVIALAKHHNGWFTEENIHYALMGWGELLTDEKLSAWLSNYSVEVNKSKTVAIIMAGNIPLVGFHDFLSVLITGNAVLAKLSSNDKTLFPLIAKYLMEIEPSLKGKITFTEEKLENFDAVIATGSNNTARYFEHYFSKGPNIIRRNRNSIAVLTGNETPQELAALGEDIFRYYGLGCRSVSKLFVPQEYDFDVFFEAIYEFNPIIQQAKYANNYDYNKAVYLMSDFKILENGFLMLKEDSSYSSPIASVFYETYNSSEELKRKLNIEAEKIQCIVAKGFVEGEISFGQTQRPELKDYADGIDTVDFLLKTSQI
ncbi:acyl-CoA reductase [Maribacter algarum]|uniref:Acyl-CoA reductase n=1 Tax=Maribacter algarum (ex Zhang et al. 2020) TaxID=2578118 RepID=A0A5S3PS58_9FLAO|nr:acyl-CoA reductase [Maribacter algarum]TMM57469.1 acyl-CoA reductase [Maribacter algarum]